MASVDSFVPLRRFSMPAPLAALAAGPHFPLLVIAALLVVWGTAVATWGLLALALPAVVFSVLMLVLLVAITRG